MTIVARLTAERELRIQREGSAVIFAICVSVAGGRASYGTATFDARSLRALIGDLRRELWAAERAEAGR